jgi:hypothetical protein
MSDDKPFGIDIEKVTRVLLADGWHELQPRGFMVGPLAYGGRIDRPAGGENLRGDHIREFTHVLGKDAIFWGFSFNRGRL